MWYDSGMENKSTPEFGIGPNGVTIVRFAAPSPEGFGYDIATYNDPVGVAWWAVYLGNRMEKLFPYSGEGLEKAIAWVQNRIR